MKFKDATIGLYKFVDGEYEDAIFYKSEDGIYFVQNYNGESIREIRPDNANLDYRFNNNEIRKIYNKNIIPIIITDTSEDDPLGLIKIDCSPVSFSDDGIEVDGHSIHKDTIQIIYERLFGINTLEKTKSKKTVKKVLKKVTKK